MRRRIFGMTASALLISTLAVTGCGTSSGPSPSSNAIRTSTTAPSKVKNKNTHIHSTSASPIVKQTFSSSRTAAVAIQNMTPNQGHPRNPLVNLGYGIRAQFSGGAGSYVFFWNEGRWQIQGSFMGPNNSGQKTMESVVAYLHSHMLPVPENNGVILINDNSQQSNPSYSTIKTTIAWNVGNKTYKLHYSGDPVSALRIAVNSSVG